MLKKTVKYVSLAALVAVITMGISNKKTQVTEQAKGNDKEVVSPQVSTNSCALPEVKNKKLVLKDLVIDQTRTIFIEGEITDNGMLGVTKKLVKLGRESEDPIYIMLDSPGGSVDAGERFISAMQSARGPVYTVCTGLCASMAAIISQYGTKRYGFNRSVLMFHDAAGGFQGYVSHMKSQMNLIERKIVKMDNFICLRIKVPCDQYKQGKLAQIWVDAEDAKEQGYLDEVVKTVEDPNVEESNMNAAPQTGFNFQLNPDNVPVTLKGFSLNASH